MKQMRVYEPTVERITVANATAFDKSEKVIDSLVNSGNCARFAVSDEMSKALLQPRTA
jgi:hypothetical protein